MDHITEIVWKQTKVSMGFSFSLELNGSKAAHAPYLKVNRRDK